MSRARSAAEAVLLFGAVLVSVTGVVLWAVRGTMPHLGPLFVLALGLSWRRWRWRHHADTQASGPQAAFFWSMAVVAWGAEGETALAAAAAVPGAAALFLAVVDARAYLASDAASRPPADPARAARLRRAAIPLWATALLTLAAAVVLGWREGVLAWPGIMLAALFGVLACLTRRDALRTGALVAAVVVALAFVVVGALALTGPPWGRRTVLVGSAAAMLLLFLTLLARRLAEGPTEPPHRPLSSAGPPAPPRHRALDGPGASCSHPGTQPIES